MSSKENYYQLLNLLDLPKEIGVKEFDEFIDALIQTKADKHRALQDLDHIIGGLSNFVLLLSLHLKQNYLLTYLQEKREIDEPRNYTKQEVAKKFRVSRRTVTNWIYDGLKTTEIGGVCRINEKDIEQFISTHRTKKFAWRSVGNVAYKKAS